MKENSHVRFDFFHVSKGQSWRPDNTQPWQWAWAVTHNSANSFFKSFLFKTKSTVLMSVNFMSQSERSISWLSTHYYIKSYNTQQCLVNLSLSKENCQRALTKIPQLMIGLKQNRAMNAWHGCEHHMYLWSWYDIIKIAVAWSQTFVNYSPTVQPNALWKHYRRETGNAVT